MLAVGIFCILLGCSLKTDTDKNVHLENKSLGYKELVLKGFNSFDASHLYSQDSCSFIKYINSYFQLNENSTSISFGSWKVYNTTCPYSDFTFSILKGQKNDSTLYYGQADVYTLKHSRSIGREVLIEFENEALNNIVNTLITPSNLTSGYNVEKLKGVIGNLYFEGFENYIGVKQPFFKRSVSLSELERRYNKDANRSIFETEILSSLESDLIIWENPEYGILIFKPDFRLKDKVKLKEFIIVSKDRIKQFRSDSYPKDIADCYKNH